MIYELRKETVGTRPRVIKSRRGSWDVEVLPQHGVESVYIRSSPGETTIVRKKSRYGLILRLLGNLRF